MWPFVLRGHELYRAVNKYPGYPRGIRRPVPERRENRRTSAVANAGAWFLIELAPARIHASSGFLRPGLFHAKARADTEFERALGCRAREWRLAAASSSARASLHRAPSGHSA